MRSEFDDHRLVTDKLPASWTSFAALLITFDLCVGFPSNLFLLFCLFTQQFQAGILTQTFIRVVSLICIAFLCGYRVAGSLAGMWCFCNDFSFGFPLSKQQVCFLHKYVEIIQRNCAWVVVLLPHRIGYNNIRLKTYSKGCVFSSSLGKGI